MIEHSGGSRAGTSGDGGGGADGGSGADGGDGERLLTAPEIGPLFNRDERTIYDWWDQGKLGYVRVGKRGRRATLAQVEARRRQLHWEKHPLEAPDPPDPPVPWGPPEAPPSEAAAGLEAMAIAAKAAIATGRAPTAEAMAAALLGSKATPETVAAFGARIRRNWHNLTEELPKPLARDLLLRFCSEVEAAVARTRLLPPVIVWALLLSVLGVLATDVVIT